MNRCCKSQGTGAASDLLAAGTMSFASLCRLRSGAQVSCQLLNAGYMLGDMHWWTQGNKNLLQTALEPQGEKCKTRHNVHMVPPAPAA